MQGRRDSRSAAWRRIAGWALAVVALALLGGGLTERLAPTSLFVPGTPSARAHEMLEREFGNSVPVTVLLEGPAAAVDRQGRRLAEALRGEPRVMVMSPWDSAALQPIVVEAGGVFTDWDGLPSAFAGSAIATNAALADEARALLRAEGR